MSMLTFEAVPQVLDGDEFPFVLGFAADSRPSLELDGVQYRRAGDRCIIDYELDVLRLRAVVMELDDGNLYLMANAGPLFNEWWPLLLRERHNPLRPWLSAGAVGNRVTMSADGGSVNVAVLQPSSWLDSTSLGVALRGGMTPDNLTRSAALALPVIKAALLTLSEYRSLVGDVPDADVHIEGSSLTLAEMLNCADAAAGAIAWEPVL